MSRTVLITGANRGLGLEFVRQYLREEWRVIATARDLEQPEDLRRLAAEEKERLELLPLDVSMDYSVKALEEALAGAPVDLLLNNAGIMGNKGPVSEVPPEEISRVFDTNVLGPWRLTKALLPNVEKGEVRKIAFVTSKMGSIGDGPGGGYYPYRISKTALNMLGANLASDLRPKGIATVLLHPGWVRTRMGGSSAPTSIEDSVTGMRKILDRLTLEDSGKFFHAEGHEVPW